LPTAELREKLPTALPSPVFELLLAELIRRGGVEIEGGKIRPKQPKVELSPLARTIEGHFESWGLTPPRPKELASKLGNDAGQTATALGSLLRDERIVKVKPDLYVHAAAIAELQGKLEDHLDANGQITPAEWKGITGASRKYSIPLAEYFDGIKLTLRVGDVRKRRG
jgi:selenocysteine-specific elongation factor